MTNSTTRRTYHLEEQDALVLDAVKNNRLTEEKRIIKRIEYVKECGLGWWHLYTTLLSSEDPLVFCAVDCSPYIDWLLVRREISFLLDKTVRMRNGGNPIAIVKGAEGMTLYESPGYRMGLAELTPK